MICIADPETIQQSTLLQALRETEKRYDIAVQIANDGIWEWNLISNRIDYSDRWKSMVGYQSEEIKNSPVEWLSRVHRADVEKLQRNIAACRLGKVSQFEIEYSLLHRDGEYRNFYGKCRSLCNSNGEVVSLIGSQTDLTKCKQVEAQLARDRNYDRLTHLPNRQLFIEQLKELSQLESNPKYHHLFGVLCLDIDRFKNVNDNFGHQIGDRLMVEIVNRLKSCLGGQDIVARMGGDEFSILLSGFKQLEYPLEIASKIQREFSEPIKIEDRSILVTTSIGIAPLVKSDLPSESDTPYSLIKSLRNAEIAMHQAKDNGKACSMVFESATYLKSVAKLKSETELRKAIELEQFTLHYQPIVKIDNNQIVGFEALIRWQHPERGFISPGDFIPLAEKTGLIVPIGWWVLRAACEQMVAWQKEHPDSGLKFISVNIAGKQFSQSYAGDIIAQILQETGLDPSCLKLEITESDIIENVDIVLATAGKLKSLGVQLSMDDFGTGYSSLSYLHSLPVDTLKIDRSFIQRLESDRHQLELVKTIIKLAEVFNLDIVAEGIERESQCDKLLDLQCEYGQGYLFSQPVSSTVATTLL